MHPSAEAFYSPPVILLLPGAHRVVNIVLPIEVVSGLEGPRHEQGSRH